MHLRHIIVDGQEGLFISEKSKLQIRSFSTNECTDVLFDVENLVCTTNALFRGMCPPYMPYFIFNAVHPLPWRALYFRDHGDYLLPIGIAEEVALILDELHLFSEKQGIQFPAALPAVTLISEKYKSDKQQIQGMSAEALLAFDQFIEELVNDRPYAAMKWLSAGYKFLMEAIHQAWPIAEKSMAARKSASTRHAANRSRKQDVFAWLDTNMVKFKSMDSAAEAIASKVTPIAFRTARDWVGEWKKLRSTGTA